MADTPAVSNPYGGAGGANNSLNPFWTKNTSAIMDAWLRNGAEFGNTIQKTRQERADLEEKKRQFNQNFAENSDVNWNNAANARIASDYGALPVLSQLYDSYSRDPAYAAQAAQIRTKMS